MYDKKIKYYCIRNDIISKIYLKKEKRDNTFLVVKI